MNSEDGPKMDLTLFDGDGAGQAGTGTAGEGQTAGPADAGRGERTGEPEEIAAFGKQTPPPDAGGEERTPETAAKTPEERRRQFRELVSGEFKDIYTQETQRIIDKRFRDYKNLEQRLEKSQGVIDTLLERYQIPDGDLRKLAQAVEEGPPPPRETDRNAQRYQQLQRLRQESVRLQRAQRTRQAVENQMRQWMTQSAQLKEVYPEFELGAEVQNPRFLSLLRSGVPVRHAYEAMHMDQVKEGVARQAAQTAEKQVVDSIRAKGARPPENGASGQSGFTVKDDVSKLTRDDRAEIARRARQGDKIIF